MRTPRINVNARYPKPTTFPNDLENLRILAIDDKDRKNIPNDIDKRNASVISGMASPLS